MNKKILYANIALLIVNLLLTASMIIKQARLEEMISGIELRSTQHIVSSESPLMIRIKYTSRDGRESVLSMPDNAIYLKNETVETALMEKLAAYRDMYAVCPCEPPDIRLTEHDGYVDGYIAWKEHFQPFRADY